MNEQRTTSDAAALDEATDRVIREMTRVEVPEDAVARVMARVRGAAADAGGVAAGVDAGARSAAGRQPARGWFGALLEPRVSWGMTAAAAALAAIVAVGVTLRVAGPERGAAIGNGGNSGGISQSATGAAPLVASATPSPSASHQELQAQPLGAASQQTAAVVPGQSTAGRSAAAAAAASSTAAPSPKTAGTTPSASPAGAGAAATPVAQVAHVHRSRGAEATRGLGGFDPTVTAAMVATPDEEPARGATAAAKTGTQAAAAAAGTATASAPAAAAAQDLNARGERALGPAPQNVKLDITITDQSTSTKPFTKTVTMIVADRDAGSVFSETRMPFLRQVKPAGSTSTAPVDQWETEVLPLNVEAWPTIYPDGHVRVRMKLNYRAASRPNASPGEPLATASITKSLSAILSDGKSAIVSQSADAATDRKVIVEVKATIQK
jgi:hypothetical protein